MGRFGNAVAGAVGTAIVTTNCFFAGTQDTPSALEANANEANNSVPSNSVVATIDEAPSATIDLSDYLSDASDVVSTAVEDNAKQEDIQEDIETGHEAEIDEMTAGGDPPNGADIIGDDETSGTGSGGGDNDSDGNSDDGGISGGDDDGDSDGDSD